jgi:predicted DNA-binding transcriptional regulator AlpA
MNSQERFLSGPKVDLRYGISSMTRWRWQRDRKIAFPAPLEINKRKLWRLSDLERWERARVCAGAQTHSASQPAISGVTGEVMIVGTSTS